MHVAAQNGHVNVIKTLASLGAAVDTAASTGGATPVYIAAAKGHVGVIKTLYKLGADLGRAVLYDGVMHSALEVAEEYDQPTAIELIRGILSKIESECECCGSSTKKLSLCSQCQKVRYCSRECQVKDHKKHRAECKAVAVAITAGAATGTS